MNELLILLLIVLVFIAIDKVFEMYTNDDDFLAVHGWFITFFCFLLISPFILLFFVLSTFFGIFVSRSFRE
jgi:hypothetical protein